MKREWEHQRLVDSVRIEALAHKTKLKHNLLPPLYAPSLIYARQTPRIAETRQRLSQSAIDRFFVTMNKWQIPIEQAGQFLGGAPRSTNILAVILNVHRYLSDRSEGLTVEPNSGLAALRPENAAAAFPDRSHVRVALVLLHSKPGGRNVVPEQPFLLLLLRLQQQIRCVLQVCGH